MRFLSISVQFGVILFAFHIFGKILPGFILNFFTHAASLFFCVYLAAWIVELTQEYFLKSKVSPGGKAVIITGCDSGFGNALARVLDKRKFKVYACCLDSTSDGAIELQNVCSNLLKIVQLDVTDNQSVQTAKDFIVDDLNNYELWALVNNAGVLKGFQIELSSMQDFEDCLNVNTLGTVRVTKAFLPLLRKSRGRIVNVCSLAGRVSCNYMAAYDISKVASVAFTEVLTQEMREFGVRVISIEPEFFRTPMCSNEYVTKVLESSIKSVDDEIIADYGEAYIEKAKQFYLMIFSNRSSNTKLALDAMEKAVVLKYPADVYKPCRNIFMRLFFFVGERVPWIIKYFFTSVALSVMGLPKPKTGMNLWYRFAI